MKETQITSGTYGHTLNATQIFSFDDQWIVYDTRNDDTHIGRTGAIERVHVETGEVQKLYATENQTLYGPGVGAVAWNPVNSNIIFIHGLQNCDSIRPYSMTRRFGAIVDTEKPGVISHAEARSIKEPLVAGGLRGGTHAHSWSADGEWISFTYNDFVIEQLEKSTGGVKDLRTIGVMAPVSMVNVGHEDNENFSGKYFAVVTATVTEHPEPGNDEIERAFDECWIGTNGYQKSNGHHQRRAVAFQGTVRRTDGTQVTEIFVSDIPDDFTKAEEGKPLEGTLSSRPNVPAGLTQTRLTFTEGNKYAGIQGPRVRLRTSPDGSKIYFPMKDDNGIVQLYAVPTAGGKIAQLTQLKYSIQAQFNVSPDGKHLSVVADNSIWLIDSFSNVQERITAGVHNDYAPVGGAIWNKQGNVLAFNRYVGSGDDLFLQIFKIEF